MSNRKLLITSVGLLALVGLVKMANLPTYFHHFTIDSKAVVSGRLSNAIGWVLGMVVPFVLAFGQWRNGGRWALGIGIYASAALLGMSRVFYIAMTSARAKPDTWGLASFLVSLLALSALAVVNFWIYVRQKKKSL